MYIDELINEIYEENTDIEDLAIAHNLGDDSALDELPAEIINRVQDQIHNQFGDTVELYHGSESELSADIEWKENTSFTDEFDIEFAGEDGYIIIAQIPVERIKFYLTQENEFVISAGQLNCEVFTVREYFGF